MQKCWRQCKSVEVQIIRRIDCELILIQRCFIVDFILIWTRNCYWIYDKINGTLGIDSIHNVDWEFSENVVRFNLILTMFWRDTRRQNTSNPTMNSTTKDRCLCRQNQHWFISQLTKVSSLDLYMFHSWIVVKFELISVLDWRWSQHRPLLQRYNIATVGIRLEIELSHTCAAVVELLSYTSWRCVKRGTSCARPKWNTKRHVHACTLFAITSGFDGEGSAITRIQKICIVLVLCSL